MSRPTLIVCLSVQCFFIPEQITGWRVTSESKHSLFISIHWSQDFFFLIP